MHAIDHRVEVDAPQDTGASDGLFAGRPPIRDWRDYGRVIRKQDDRLLRRLDDFPNSILVAGCQRSGTTMLGKVISQSDELVDYAFGREISLDAALILYGYVQHEPRGRYCFQTTWLNQCYEEYLRYEAGHKIVWMLRNPFSVVRSMLYNWPSGALDELFLHCGVSALPQSRKLLYRLLSLGPINSLQRLYFGYKGKGARFLQREQIDPDLLMYLDFDQERVFRGVSKVERACYAYNSKVSQLFDLAAGLDEDRFMVVEYNDLVLNKDVQLPKIFEFLGLAYRAEFADIIHAHSLEKVETLTENERTAIEAICQPVYMRALQFVSLDRPSAD